MIAAMKRREFITLLGGAAAACRALRQRIKAGLKRAVAQGVKLGRPKITVPPNGRCESSLRRAWAS
jgi:DNA invertase Pin-like site-specific DNA recombinase